MITQKELSHSNNRVGTGSHDPQIPIPDISKERWLQKYASRIHMVWSQWQTPLGVASAYTDQIKKDLSRFYDDPLKRIFVEATY